MPFYDQDSLIEGALSEGGELKRDALAHARHHAYAVFSRLFLEGVTAVTLPYATAIPELATHLPDSFNADEWAAAHYNLFQMNLFPFEAIFLGEDGLLGGDVTTAVYTQYQQAGFAVDTAATSPDHIGHELAFLAFLCGAEADAWEDGLEETAVSLQQRQHTFLTAHLLTWLLPLSQAIHTQNTPFYHALVELTVALVADHFASFGNQAGVAREFPTPPDLLANDATRLKDIAEFIMTPAYSGFFMSRDDVSRIAKGQKLPRGFGSRTQMLTNLVKTAVQYDTLPQLLTQLQSFVETREAALTQQTGAYPNLTPFAQGWISRCQGTQHLLTNISKQALDR